MNSYRAKFFSLVLAAIPLSTVAQQATLTLEECSSLARTNHPMIRQHDLITKSSEYTISNAGKAYLPNISVTGIGAYILNGFPSMTLPGAAPKEDQKTQAIAILQLILGEVDIRVTQPIRQPVAAQDAQNLGPAFDVAIELRNRTQLHNHNFAI